MTEEELIARYRSADSSGEARLLLNELFSRLLGPVGLWCCRFTGDHEWAPDLTQEVLMKVFRNLDSFRGHSKFSSWVYTITRNHCLKAMRSRGPAPVRVAEDQLDGVAGREPDPYTLVARRDSAQSVTALLKETLTDLESRVLTLHYGEGVPLDAVTRILGLCNISGAKAYIVSAKRKLQAAVQRGQS